MTSPDCGRTGRDTFECWLRLPSGRGAFSYTEMKKLEIVQVLRGFAASFVMIYHLKDVLPADHRAKQIMDQVFMSGAAGVDLFFIISGFLMVLIMPEDKGSRWKLSMRFLLKRLIRIWPAYIVATLGFYFIINGLNFYPESIKRLAKSLLFLPLASTEPPFFGHAFLLVGWTLNYEMYFYILIAFVLLFGRYKWLVFFVVIGLTLLVIPAGYTHISIDPSDQGLSGAAYLNLITNPIIWNFVAGVIIGMLFNNKSTRTALELFFFKPYRATAMLLVVLFLVFSGFWERHGPLDWGFAMAVVFIVLLFFSTGKEISYPWYLVYLGDMSYSIYLLHLPVLVAANTIFRRMGLEDTEPLLKIALVALMTLLLSHFLFQNVEKKAGNRLRSCFLPANG